MGSQNDSLGHGQIHRCKYLALNHIDIWVLTRLDKLETLQIVPTPILELRVIFPTGKFTSRFLQVPEHLENRFPAKKFSALEISLEDGAFVEVDGFGLPFRNPGHEVDDRINKGSIVATSMTFIDILRQRKWHIIVEDRLARFKQLWKKNLVTVPFTLPYGDKHWFDLARYESQFANGVSKGSQLPLSVNFPDVPSMQATLTQSAVQDCLWIAIEVSKIFAKKLPAYFVPSSKDATDHSQFFAIIAMECQYRRSIDKVWSRVTKDGWLRLAFHEDMSPMDAPGLAEHKKWYKCADSVWDAKIMEKADRISALEGHPLGEFDLVLLVQRPRASKASENKEDAQEDVEDALERLKIKTFLTRDLANLDLHAWNAVSLLFDPQLSELERKVKAVNQHALPLIPSNLGAWKLSEDGQIPDELKFGMMMHLDLQLGRGFSSMWQAVRQSLDSNNIGWRLPEISFLEIDNLLLHCLMEEILEQDRARFCQYMGHLPLGFGIITAVSIYYLKFLCPPFSFSFTNFQLKGPGFGKTSALAVATLGMAHCINKVYVSAPTHVAVDNFARRIDTLDQRVVARHNKLLTPDAVQAPIRRKLVIRGFRLRDEIKAFRNLLQQPNIGDAAAPKTKFRGTAKWKLHLSATYWLLKALGSPAVPALNEEDNASIGNMREKLEKHDVFAALVDVARGKLSWADYLGHESNSTYNLTSLFETLIEDADLVCTTPSLSEKVPYHKWKTTCAKGIAVDEAANMGRPDLYCVW